jgi:hypothetical protein
MAVDRYKHFRWTPRTAWITVAYVLVVPSIMGYFAYTTDVSYALPSFGGRVSDRQAREEVLEERRMQSQNISESSVVTGVRSRLGDTYEVLA